MGQLGSWKMCGLWMVSEGVIGKLEWNEGEDEHDS